MSPRAFAVSICLLLISSVSSKSDADATVNYKDATGILNNLLDDSNALAFANQKDGTLPTEISHAFFSLLKLSANGIVTHNQQNMADQLVRVVQLLAKHGQTPALAQFVNQTNTMIETQLKAQLRQSLVNLSLLVNNSFAQGYQQCDSTYAAATSSTGIVTNLTQAFTPLVPDFASCRSSEGTLQTSMTQAAALAASLSATQASKCATFATTDGQALSCPILPNENSSAYALRIAAYFKQQTDLWAQQRSDCANATIAASTQNSTSQAASSSWSTQKTTCDNKQDNMDAASCSIYTASVTVCQNYQSCYTQFASSFQTYQQGYNAQLSGLVSQWASLLQMQCLINGITSPSTQNCSNQALMTQQATQSLPLYYPTTRSAPTCTTATGYAGTSSYVQTVYGSLPANAPAKFCVASCCPTTTTTTTRVAVISGSITFNLPTVSASQLQSSLPAALAASLGVSASQVSATVSGSASPYAITYFVSAPVSSQSSIQTTINGFSSAPTILQTNVAQQLSTAGATVSVSAVGVGSVSAPSSSTVGSQTLPNLASAVAVSSGSLTLNLGSVTGSSSSVSTAAQNALTAYFGTSQVMTNLTQVSSNPLSFNVSYNVSFPIGSLPTLQTLTNGATSTALQSSLSAALASAAVPTSSVSIQNFVAPVAGLVPASSVRIVATTTATTTTMTTTSTTTTAVAWVTLYSTGSYGSTVNSQTTFNTLVRASSGIVRRECTDCSSANHKDIYYVRKIGLQTWDAYADLLVTWPDCTAAAWHTNFDLYSSLSDALANRNAWQYCNGADPGIGFPRDASPASFTGWQWNSLTKGGLANYKFSALNGVTTTTTTIAGWSILYSTGGFGSTVNSQTQFNALVRASNGIIRRECTDCSSAAHQDIYYKRKIGLSTWDAYQELLVTWPDCTAAGWHTNFDLYSSLSDAQNNRNAWQYCNGADPGVAFPRDSSPSSFTGWQWISLSNGGSRANWRFTAQNR
jgi:hypothetical protein